MNVEKNNESDAKIIEKQIIAAFPIFKNLEKSHPYFCSYDGHKKEEDNLNFWKKVIRFILSINDTRGMLIKDILDLCKIKDRKPIGLENIIKELLKKDIVSLSQICSDNYHEYEQQSSYLNKISTYLISYVFPKKVAPFEDEFVIFKDVFNSLAFKIMQVIEDHAKKEDLESITVSELKKKISMEDSKSEELFYMLKVYLIKKKKIIHFILPDHEKEFFKSITKEKSFTQVDVALANLSYLISDFQEKIANLEEINENIMAKVKNYIRKNDRNVIYYMY